VFELLSFIAPCVITFVIGAAFAQLVILPILNWKPKK